jgi:hypothetical protein
MKEQPDFDDKSKGNEGRLDNVTTYRENETDEHIGGWRNGRTVGGGLLDDWMIR